MNASDPTAIGLIEPKGVEDAARGASGDNAGDDGSGGGTASDEFLRLIPHEFARRHLILSMGVLGQLTRDSSGGTSELLHIAASTRPAPIHNVGVRLGRAVVTRVVEAEALASAIDRAYTTRHDSDSGNAARSEDAPPEVTITIDGDIVGGGTAGVDHELKTLLAQADSDLLNTQGKAPLVKLVDLLLFEAVQRRASDIHVQPLSDRTLVRYRLDGVLHTVRELPPTVLPAIVSRVKVMARLDVAEQRAPQDGRTTVTLGGGIGPGASSRPRRIDLRISTLPTTYGERVVIRLLDTATSPHLLTFATLGMPPEVEGPLSKQISRSSGIVLVTGPTGSGKTTTLYTALARISTQRTSSHVARSSSSSSSLVPSAQSLAPSSSPLPIAHSPLPSSSDLNIMTIEDPVEYDLSIAGLSISQTQLNTKKGVTFAAGLRHILRQDPDVIMVGEIRDEETAKVAVQASLTGHLVLSTLHTNDAASAVARLLDLNVEPFLVGSTLAAVLAQRLVRRVHIDCAGTGCPGCLHTGYRGRLGVFELLVLDAELRQMVADRVPASDIKALAMKKGLVDLKEAGQRLIFAGHTTQREIARVIEGIE
jgi:general secretion pathway protein E